MLLIAGGKPFEISDFKRGGGGALVALSAADSEVAGNLISKVPGGNWMSRKRTIGK